MELYMICFSLLYFKQILLKKSVCGPCPWGYRWCSFHSHSRRPLDSTRTHCALTITFDAATDLPPCFPSPLWWKTPGRGPPVGTPSAGLKKWHHPFLRTYHHSLSVRQIHVCHMHTCTHSEQAVQMYLTMAAFVPSNTRAISAGGHRKQMRTSQADRENYSLPIPCLCCQPLGLLTINQHNFPWKAVFRLERAHTMKQRKGRGITCRSMRFPLFMISNEDSQSSCACMKLPLLRQQVADLYRDL